MKTKDLLQLCIAVVSLTLISCKKNETKKIEKHTATFVTNTSVAYSINFGEITTGQSGNLQSKKCTGGALEHSIEISGTKGTEIQLFVLSDNSVPCYIEAAIKIDGVEKARHDKACPAGITGVVYKFE